MRIWHENYTLEHVITLRDNNINKHLGIKFTDITDNSISATMPVRTSQDNLVACFMVALHVFSQNLWEVLPQIYV